ncbi:glycosyltransferase [Acinetobacter defluvii]|uniref:Glycosyltransferase n=1 Tax=Acinetobacter defluvii TaxID=1871111 RepID=A0A2S2FAU5_9GAMM|nr:glycosyltransferase [Acinetobacter defluvii]AWL28097.1 glycosyltransferase [Acinetobacter defluvii]
MQSSPLVSIITPFFNNQTTIIETIISVKSQSYNNIEHIIIDDGSSTPIFEVKTIKNYLSDIITIQQKNMGVAAARNNAVQQAKGDILVFLDADDLIDTLYVEKVVSAFLQYNNASMVACYVQEIGRSQKKIKIKKFNLEEFYFHNTLFPSIMAVKKDLFDQVGGYNTSLKVCEDWDLYLKIAKINPNVFIIPEYLFYYRKHKNLSSLTDLMSKDKHIVHQAYYQLYREHYNFYDEVLVSPLNVAYLKLKTDKRVKKVFKIIKILLAFILLCAVLNLKISYIDTFGLIVNISGIFLILILFFLMSHAEKKLKKFNFDKIPQIHTTKE